MGIAHKNRFGKLDISNLLGAQGYERAKVKANSIDSRHIFKFALSELNHFMPRLQDINDETRHKARNLKGIHEDQKCMLQIQIARQ